MSSIPDDVYYEILLRVPAKSTFVFKSVCRSWYKIICDPSFIEKKPDILTTKRLYVTFNKRKRHAFQKASELSVLSGAEVALIIFPPEGKPFAFGHPTPAHMLDRYLNNGGEAVLGTSPQDDAELSLCRQQFMEAEEKLEAEKTRGFVLKTLLNCNVGDNNQFCLRTHIDSLGMDELQQMTSDIEQLKKNVEKRAHEIVNNVPVKKKKKRKVM